MYTKSYRRIQAYREAESPRLAQEAANPPEVSFRLSTSKAHNLEIPHVLAKHWSITGFFLYFCPFPFFFFPCPSTRNQSSLSLQNDPFRSTQHTRTKPTTFILVGTLHWGTVRPGLSIELDWKRPNRQVPFYSSPKRNESSGVLFLLLPPLLLVLVLLNTTSQRETHTHTHTHKNNDDFVRYEAFRKLETARCWRIPARKTTFLGIANDDDKS